MLKARKSLFAVMFILSINLLFVSCECKKATDPGGSETGIVPVINSLTTDIGNGFTNDSNIAVHIQTVDAVEMRVGISSSQDSELIAEWQDVDTMVVVQLSGRDGALWIGCQAKSSTGNVSPIEYTSVKLDIRVSISSFNWSSSAGDTLMLGDSILFSMQTIDDSFGPEADGKATVFVDGWHEIDLPSQPDGSYLVTYTITSETPEVSNASVSLEFTDRAGNIATAVEADHLLTVWQEIPAGTERSFILGSSDEQVVMCWIPPGEFQMGRQDEQQDSDDDESPKHPVTFSNGFWLGKYEVTQSQWEAVVFENPSNFEGESLPVEQVSWDDIQIFEMMVRNEFRLPSEAEWEYACRAGTTTRFYWGDDPDYTSIGDYAVYFELNTNETADVGSKLPNHWGLYDMSGNVWEWCEDRRHRSYRNAPDDGSAWMEDPAGENRMYRGGSYFNDPKYCRSANRGSFEPADSRINLGFRLARDSE